MLHVVLFEPEIPPNTGNIIRLCANTGAQLHLIHPLGFELDDKQLRRAGLDYREWVNIVEYKNIDSFFKKYAKHRVFACSTKGEQLYTDITFQDDDILLFGPETRGLPQALLNNSVRIPMLANSRSLNLSNACAVILYEAWRQLDFK